MPQVAPLATQEPHPAAEDLASLVPVLEATGLFEAIEQDFEVKLLGWHDPDNGEELRSGLSRLVRKCRLIRYAYDNLLVPNLFQLFQSFFQ